MYDPVEAWFGVVGDPPWCASLEDKEVPGPTFCHRQVDGLVFLSASVLSLRNDHVLLSVLHASFSYLLVVCLHFRIHQLDGTHVGDPNVAGLFLDGEVEEVAPLCRDEAGGEREVSNGGVASWQDVRWDRGLEVAVVEAVWFRAFVLRHLAPKVPVVFERDWGGNFRYSWGAAAIVEEGV
jgi:hypothetical protein